MKVVDAISKAMDDQGISTAKLGRLLGYTPQKVWNILHSYQRKSMNVSTLIRIAEVLDYKVVLIPNEKKYDKIVLENVE